MAKRKISKAVRRHQDALRLSSVKVAGVYQSRLMKDRRKELRRVLDLCRDLNGPEDIATALQTEINESGYLPGWWTGLWTTAGLPIAQDTAKQLRQEKASAEENTWLRMLRRYAVERAGSEILTVTGTWKKTLVQLLADILLEDLGNMAVEKVTKELYRRYTGEYERWMCRRIAQTECMIGAADAAEYAARDLGLDYTKTWCISGLGNTRETHEEMDGVTVGKDELFRLTDCVMRFPHDTMFNPPASEIINCACSCIRSPK